MSERINELSDLINESELFNSENLRKIVLLDFIPKILVDLVGGYEIIKQRLPLEY